MPATLGIAGMMGSACTQSVLCALTQEQGRGVGAATRYV